MNEAKITVSSFIEHEFYLDHLDGFWHHVRDSFISDMKWQTRRLKPPTSLERFNASTEPDYRLTVFAALTALYRYEYTDAVDPLAEIKPAELFPALEELYTAARPILQGVISDAGAKLYMPDFNVRAIRMAFTITGAPRHNCFLVLGVATEAILRQYDAAGEYKTAFFKEDDEKKSKDMGVVE